MEKKISVWKATLTHGLILGLIGIVYTLLMYFFDLTFNKTQGYVFLLILIVSLFYLVRSYRENYLHGHITYSQSVGAGVVIFLYYSLIAAIFTYLLYKIIDPGLTAKQLIITEEQILKKGLPQEAVDTAMNFQKKFLKPEIVAPFSVLGNMLTGTVISLLVAIFVRKEGNPLIDTPENNQT